MRCVWLTGVNTRANDRQRHRSECRQPEAHPVYGAFMPEVANLTPFSGAGAYLHGIRHGDGKREIWMRHQVSTVDSSALGNTHSAHRGDVPGGNPSGSRWGAMLASSPVTHASVATSAHATPPADPPGWCPQLIGLDVSAKDKHDLFKIASEMLQRDHGVDPAPILRALWRREEAGSTGLGQGIAIPHARVPGITEPLTMLLRLRAPILFDAPDGKPVSLVIVIIVPADDATERHLEMLAGIASLCTERAFRRRLAEAADSRDVQNAFADTGDFGGGARPESLARKQTQMRKV